MIEIYTDGSACVHETNKGKGGFGIVFVVNNKIVEVISRGFTNTKTGRMELTAALTALRMVRKDQRITINSDSLYVVNTFNERWIYKWKRIGWSCKNSDIMKQLLIEYEKFGHNKVKFRHVKGHNGDKYNEIADTIANYKNFTKTIRDNEEAK